MTSPIACLGDSITKGISGGGGMPYPHKLESTLSALYPGVYQVGNYGVGGATIANMQTTYNSSIKNKGFVRLLLMGGVNDLVAGTTAAVIWATMDAIITDALAAGIIVCVSTVLPFKGYDSNASHNAERATLNSSIMGRATILKYDGYTDADDGTGTMKAAWGSPDGLHPGQAGNDFMATGFKAALGL